MADEEKQEKKEQIPAQKKKFPAMIIVIVLAVVLVLGGAAAGYFLFLGPKAKASGKEGAVKEVKHEQTKEKGSGEGEGGASGLMKQLDPFIVNLADAQGQRYLKAVMQVEVDNPSVEGEIQGKLPQIRDEILMILSNKTFDDVSTTSGKHMVKREIASAVNKYLTTGQVTQVYFTEFVVQ
ncbi:MAG: flagellar basal body-associated FliL family protein [Desulfomonilia bacterium]|jgi:flagellar FliL protein